MTRRKKDLRELENGTLLDATNNAVLAFGHGFLRNPFTRKRLEIGGSTGGKTRHILDGQKKTIPEEFLAEGDAWALDLTQYLY